MLVLFPAVPWSADAVSNVLGKEQVGSRGTQGT